MGAVLQREGGDYEPAAKRRIPSPHGEYFKQWNLCFTVTSSDDCLAFKARKLGDVHLLSGDEKLHSAVNPGNQQHVFSRRILIVGNRWSSSGESHLLIHVASCLQAGCKAGVIVEGQR